MSFSESTHGRNFRHGDVADTPESIQKQSEEQQNVPPGQVQSIDDHRMPKIHTPPSSAGTIQKIFTEQAERSGAISNVRPTIVSFGGERDLENPFNWPKWKKSFVLLAGIISVMNSTLGSSLPSGAIGFIGPYFNVTNEEQLVLPISLFLVGYVTGPSLFGPLSETYGRRIIMFWSFAAFTLFTMACALSPNWPSFLVFRLLSGFMASSPIAVVGGLYADIYGHPVTRGRAMAIFMTTTVVGPEVAPLISGFVSPISWRWTFWIGLVFAGASLIMLFFLPETFGPVLLKRKAERMRKEVQGADPTRSDTKIFAPIELEKKGWKQMVTVTLMRPLRMIAFEAIVLFTCLYLSLAYSIFYLFFQAYPIIFQGPTYHMSAGVSGFAYLPVVLGACIALVIFLCYDGILQRAKRNHKPWAEVEEYRRLPLALLGGPSYVISLFWLGWTARENIHWIVPMLAGIPFGMGFMLIFMALLNYVTDAYEIYAASAMSATSISRSSFGAILPFAAKPMYQRLGVSWASSLLGFLSLAMSIIPFAFIRYGERIRANSHFCLELKARKAEIIAAKEGEERNNLDVEHGTHGREELHR